MAMPPRRRTTSKDAINAEWGNQGFSTLLLEGRQGLTTMPPTTDVPPKASPSSAKAKGLAGPSPDNPDTQTQTNHIVDDHSQSPPSGDCCGTDDVTGMCDLLPPRQPKGPPPSYMTPATMESHILFL
jgi:hypothetical protein